MFSLLESSICSKFCCCYITSVVSDSVQPQRRQPTRLPCPWDSPDKNTGVGCHFLLQCMKVKSESEVAQSCPTPSDPMDCSRPGSSIHGIFQARVLEWVTIAFSSSKFYSFLFSSVQFSRSVMSDFLWPHEPQPAKPPCLSPTPGVHPNSCPSSRWYHPAISSSAFQQTLENRLRPMTFDDSHWSTRCKAQTMDSAGNMLQVWVELV